jgi:hypothetical protein
VVDYCNNEANDLGFVRITVNEVNERPWLLPVEGVARVGQTNHFVPCTGDVDCPRNPLAYTPLGSMPTGMTLDANTGVVRWAPTLAQVGTYTNRVRLCDGGSPNYCVTNSFIITVTTNTPPCALHIQQVGGDTYEFIILEGSAEADYLLQGATVLDPSPCHWQPVLRISPDTMPFRFVVSSREPMQFFRLNQVGRSP